MNWLLLCLCVLFYEHMITNSDSSHDLTILLLLLICPFVYKTLPKLSRPWFFDTFAERLTGYDFVRWNRLKGRNISDRYLYVVPAFQLLLPPHFLFNDNVVPESWK